MGVLNFLGINFPTGGNCSRKMPENGTRCMITYAHMNTHPYIYFNKNHESVLQGVAMSKEISSLKLITPSHKKKDEQSTDHRADARPGQRHGEGCHGNWVEVQDLGIHLQRRQSLTHRNCTEQIIITDDILAI